VEEGWVHYAVKYLQQSNSARAKFILEYYGISAQLPIPDSEHIYPEQLYSSASSIGLSYMQGIMADYGYTSGEAWDAHVVAGRLFTLSVAMMLDDAVSHIKGVTGTIVNYLYCRFGCLKIIGSVNDYSISELRAAQYMANQGNDVVLRPVINGGNLGRTSDLLVNGVRYDVYTPTTGNPSRIISAIAKKNSQASGIVLDLSNTSVSIADLGNILYRVNKAGATNIIDIVIIGGN
jgi:hypothetical protein